MDDAATCRLDRASAYFEIGDGAVGSNLPGRTAERRYGHGCISVVEDPSRPTSSNLRHGQAAADAQGRPQDLMRELDSVDSPLAGRLATAIADSEGWKPQIPEPTLAPAMIDGDGEDEHVEIRGNPKNLGEVVPRRFLKILGG